VRRGKRAKHERGQTDSKNTAHTKTLCARY
jgi:hypothetical protein